MSTVMTVLTWRNKVTEAAMTLERRWTYKALRRLDPELATALWEQRQDFVNACISGSAADIAEHGGGTVRGYAVAVKRLEEAAFNDDAYLIGTDPASGLKVAIGQQRAAAERVREVHGEGVIWISPDEVAHAFSMMGEDVVKFIALVKKQFPGAELLDAGDREPAQ